MNKHKYDGNPFDGSLSINSRVKKEYRKLGRITHRAIYDVFGEKIAKFEEKKYDVDDRGREVKVYTYLGEDGSYELIRNKVYLNGELIGKVTLRQKIRTAVTTLIILLLILLSAFSLVKHYLPEPLNINMDVKDDNGSWNDQYKVHIFDSTIMPGSNGKYEFNVTNSSEIDLEYSFRIEEVYNHENVKDFPMIYRLMLNNEYKTEWMTGKELKVYDIMIKPNEEHHFVLEWSWPFDGQNDDIDTFYGNSNGEYSIMLYLSYSQYTEE